MNIATVIKETIDRWGETPQSINDGDCEWFAQEIASKVPGARPIWDWQLDNKRGYHWGHCFILYKDRFYDSECPDGVIDWIDLPLFGRTRPNCEGVWGTL